MLLNFFDFYLVITSIIAGLVAAISGFGIGSLLTPLLSIQISTKIAIAAVSLPHFIGTVIRFFLLKTAIDKRIFFRFGISSLLGGLCGALLFSQTTAPALTLIFGIILIFSAVMECSGFLQQLHVGKNMALAGGALSGFLGGLVGNQGGIRSAALLHFDLDKKAFVATATAIGLVIDMVRMPIYFFSQGSHLISAWHEITLMTIGVIIGTWIGLKLLDYIPKDIFRRVVASIVFLLGLFMAYKGIVG